MSAAPPLKAQRSFGPIEHGDGHARCPWAGRDPLYVAYHDTEWGVPEWNDRALFEKLVLDGFQAGLSWITILRKREAFRRAFDEFDPARIVQYRDTDIARLLADAGIVRNKAKIVNTVAMARFWLATQEREGFAHMLWGFVDGQPVQNSFASSAEVPTESAASRALAKHLRGHGLLFCGPTIVYAFMQAVGMVNDHLVECFRHADCAHLGHARA